jgi:hypothetical protein
MRTGEPTGVTGLIPMRKIQILLVIDPRSPDCASSRCYLSDTKSQILEEACCGDGNDCVSCRLTSLSLRVLLPEFQLFWMTLNNNVAMHSPEMLLQFYSGEAIKSFMTYSQYGFPSAPES